MTTSHLSSVLFLLSLINSTSIAAYPSASSLTLDCPYFYSTLDAAGYSDVIYWGGNTINHPHDFHEVLSGEWGSAIFYDNIASEPNATWLTDSFVFPGWTTNSDFQISASPSEWDDPNNPVNGYDTGQSKIINAQVEVTIDYEIADLNAVLGLGDDSWSPMGLKDANGTYGHVKSDRYLLLQTYTIKNIKPSGNVTELRFYQLLHSHGADDYGPTVYASYSPANYSDPLADYIPWNPVHEVGNFHYDFTQWNNLDEKETADHVDWVGFSCTVEPDVFDVNFYEGHNDGYPPPRPGTHWNVQERNLNGETYAYGETAGAMGWYLPDLEPNESTSITVAFMFGYGPVITSPVTLVKTDDVGDSNCVDPNNRINYSIHYDMNGFSDNNIVIIDTLPSRRDLLFIRPLRVIQPLR